MTLQDIKETKRYGRTDGRTHGRTDGRTDGQRENSIPPTNKVCGGYNKNDISIVTIEQQVGRALIYKWTKVSAISEGSSDFVHIRRIARAFAARIHGLWVLLMLRPKIGHLALLGSST